MQEEHEIEKATKFKYSNFQFFYSYVKLEELGEEAADELKLL